MDDFGKVYNDLTRKQWQELKEREGLQVELQGIAKTYRQWRCGLVLKKLFSAAGISQSQSPEQKDGVSARTWTQSQSQSQWEEVDKVIPEQFITTDEGVL